MPDAPPPSTAVPPRGFAVRDVARLRAGGGDRAPGVDARVADQVAEEVPVALRYNGRPFAVMMATPCDLADFALGFSLTEGLVDASAQLHELVVDSRFEGIELAMAVSADAPAARIGEDAQAQRLLPGRSGCGLCGTRELEDATRPPPALPGDARRSFAADALSRAFAALPAHQPMNAATGAVHAAAWADAGGRIVLAREDVGRHNALDKLVGALVRAGHAPGDGMLLLTSRASHEMVSKAARAGIGFIAAISAPTALAVDVARGAGVCLVGFARPGGCNVYAHPERLLERDGG